MTSKLMAPTLIIMLIVFSIIVVGLAVSSGILLQTVAFAQTLEADDATTTSSQDSSSDDNVLDNENDFGDDGTAIGQDNEADEDAANVGVQDQDATQEEDQTQDAVKTNIDFDVQIGVQRPPSSITPPGPTPTCQGEPATIVGTPGDDDLEGQKVQMLLLLLQATIE